MPGLDGLTLVREYRNNPATRDIPIIVLSTKEDPLVKSAAFAAGANDYLVKLPDTIELVARIRYHSRSYPSCCCSVTRPTGAAREPQQQLLDTNLMLQRLMNSDGLTGLSNRRHFDEYLELEWRRAMREQQQLSLLMIDVDYFKVYNDSFGHLAGDEALRQVAEAIRGSCSRPTDLPARYGGEESRWYCPTPPRAVRGWWRRSCARTVHGLNIPHTASQDDSRLTVSIGLATQTPAIGSHCRQLISAADKGLYQAKNSGVTRSVSPEVQAAAQRAAAAPWIGYTRGLFTEFVREPRAMEIQPILNTIKDLTERSQSIRYL